MLAEATWTLARRAIYLLSQPESQASIHSFLIVHTEEKE